MNQKPEYKIKSQHIAVKVVVNILVRLSKKTKVSLK